MNDKPNEWWNTKDPWIYVEFVPEQREAGLFLILHSPRYGNVSEHGPFQTMGDLEEKATVLLDDLAKRGSTIMPSGYFQ